MSLNEVIYFIYFLQSEQHTHTHTHTYIIKSMYNTGMQEEKKNEWRDGIYLSYLVIAFFSLLFLKYDLSYARNLFVFVLDDELLCESVGEFDKLPDDVFKGIDGGSCGGKRIVSFVEWWCWWKFSLRFNSDCQTVCGHPVRPFILRDDNELSN